MDTVDGLEYTKADFLGQYGGLVEWDAAGVLRRNSASVKEPPRVLQEKVYQPEVLETVTPKESIYASKPRSIKVPPRVIQIDTRPSRMDSDSVKEPPRPVQIDTRRPRMDSDSVKEPPRVLQENGLRSGLPSEELEEEPDHDLYDDDSQLWLHPCPVDVVRCLFTPTYASPTS